MTLCDNGLLTYHPSLHVSLGEGLGTRGRVTQVEGGADSTTEGKQASVGSKAPALRPEPHFGGLGTTPPVRPRPGPSPSF